MAPRNKENNLRNYFAIEWEDEEDDGVIDNLGAESINFIQDLFEIAAGWTREHELQQLRDQNTALLEQRQLEEEEIKEEIELRDKILAEVRQKEAEIIKLCQQQALDEAELETLTGTPTIEDGAVQGALDETEEK